MPLSLAFVLLVLATYRVLRLIQRDTILDRPRERFYNAHPYDGGRAATRYVWSPQLREMVAEGRGGLAPKDVSRWGQMVRCPWCLSVHLSAVAVFVLDQYVSLPLPLLWWAACSTAVALLAGLDG